MKALILAAGTGTRLRPLTDSRPKCLAPLHGAPLLQYQLESLSVAAVDHIAIVTGYKHEALDSWPLIKYYNPKYDATNMVYSLFCAQQEFDDDLLVIYGDVIFEPNVILRLRDSAEDFSVVIDTGWLQLWQLRMEDPLIDAESLQLDEQGYITDIGRRVSSYAEIQGQYTGLIKISAAGLNKISRLYHSLNKAEIYDDKNFDNMYMTSLIRTAIDNGLPFKAVTVRHGWLEVDRLADLQCYENCCPQELFDFSQFSFLA